MLKKAAPYNFHEVLNKIKKMTPYMIHLEYDIASEAQVYLGTMVL